MNVMNSIYSFDRVVISFPHLSPWCIAAEKQQPEKWSASSGFPLTSEGRIFSRTWLCCTHRSCPRRYGRMRAAKHNAIAILNAGHPPPKWSDQRVHLRKIRRISWRRRRHREISFSDRKSLWISMMPVTPIPLWWTAKICFVDEFDIAIWQNLSISQIQHRRTYPTFHSNFCICPFSPRRSLCVDSANWKSVNI